VPEQRCGAMDMNAEVSVPGDGQVLKDLGLHRGARTFSLLDPVRTRSRFELG
jgi:hypothetical protein